MTTCSKKNIWKRIKEDKKLRVQSTCSRLFFPSFFEPASSICIQYLILNPNHSMKLFNSLGLWRNLQKLDLNLPEISCSGSPLLCLCVKLFGFVLFVNILSSLMLVLNWDTLASQKSFSFVIVWNINALSITHVEHRLIDFVYYSIFMVQWFQSIL